MKKLLHVLMHLLFVIGGLLLFQLIFMGKINVITPKGQSTYYVSVDDINGNAIESDSINQMFGASVCDVLDYGYLSYEYENEPNLQNTVSANSIGRSDFSDELRTYSEFFKKGNTNVNFMIDATIEGNHQVFSNTGMSYKDSADLRGSVLSLSGFYIDFDSSSNVYDTNTRIGEKTFLKILESSGYKNASDIHVTIGLNKDVGNIEDSYYEGVRIYNSYTDRMPLKLIGIVLCFFGVLCIAFILTIKEDKLKYYDYAPLEIRFVIFACFNVLIGLFINSIDSLYEHLIAMFLNNFNGTLIIGALILLICSLIYAFFYFGFVRRIKGKIIWKTSLTKKLINFIRRIFSDLCRNKGSLFKTILIVGGISLINILFMIGIIKSNIPALFIVGLVTLDVIIGIVVYRSYKERKDLLVALRKIAGGNVEVKLDLQHMHGDNINHAEAVNQIGDAVTRAVETSMKDEKMKADLITNVSHDLKTPLTSIINYVDLLKKERIDNERAEGYIAILDEKSQRLKQMTDDLVEASKISSGNLVLQMEKINLKELLVQASGEFIDRFEEKKLTINGTGPDEAVYINADSRSIYRVIENLFNNIYKYALEGTRVYLDITKQNGNAVLTIKNISANEINNVSVEELTERFIRGDESRATEGSGLGLSIAKSLTEAMGGNFQIALDGDLFKVILVFKEIQ